MLKICKWSSKTFSSHTVSKLSLWAYLLRVVSCTATDIKQSSYTKSVSSRSCATGWKTRVLRRIPSRHAVSSEFANTLPATKRSISFCNCGKAISHLNVLHPRWNQVSHLCACLLCRTPWVSGWSTAWLWLQFWYQSFCQREMELLPDMEKSHLFKIRALHIKYHKSSI